MSDNHDRLRRWDQLSRLFLLGAAIALSVVLWDMNNPMPAKNRGIYIQILAVNQQTSAIKSLLKEMRDYGQSRPEFNRLLEHHKVEKLIQTKIKESKKH